MFKKLLLATSISAIAVCHSATIDVNIPEKSFSSFDTPDAYNVTSYLLVFDSEEEYNIIAQSIDKPISIAFLVSDYSIGSFTANKLGEVASSLASDKLVADKEYLCAVLSANGMSYILSTPVKAVAHGDGNGSTPASFSQENFSKGWQFFPSCDIR